MIIFEFFELEKNCSIDLICVSPIPSKSSRLFKINFLLFELHKSKKFLEVLKNLAKVFAFS